MYKTGSMARVDYKPIYDKAIEHLQQLMERREELDIQRDTLDKQIRVVKHCPRPERAWRPRFAALVVHER